jgi:dihydrofolate reductase
LSITSFEPRRHVRHPRRGRHRRDRHGPADGLDVRLGGGAATIQPYPRAGLLDEMPLVIVPVLLGAGERRLPSPKE